MPRLLVRPESVALIALVAIALRLAVGWWFEAHLPPGQRFELGDSDGYWTLGQQIAAGEPYEYRSSDARIFRMPGYPTLLAPIFLIFGREASPMWGRALSALCGGATAALVAWWGAELFHLKAGLIAGWITAVYPGSIAMGVFVLSEAPFCLFMVAQLALAAAAWKSTTPRTTAILLIACGFAASAAVYMRPSWLLFVPFATVVGISLCRKRLRLVVHSAAVCTVVGICLMPWWIRNYRVTGHFVPTTLQVGASLFDGLNELADGSSNMWFTPWLLGGSEYEQDRSMRSAAINWAKSDTVRVIQLATIKFARMWNVVPNEPMFGAWPIKLGVFITYTPLLLLGLYGAARLSRGGFPYLLCSLPAVYFTLLHTLFVASVRYREPPMLGLIVLAAAVIVGEAKANSEATTTAKLI